MSTEQNFVGLDAVQGINRVQNVNSILGVRPEADNYDSIDILEALNRDGYQERNQRLDELSGELQTLIDELKARNELRPQLEELGNLAEFRDDDNIERFNQLRDAAFNVSFRDEGGQLVGFGQDEALAGLSIADASSAEEAKNTIDSFTDEFDDDTRNLLQDFLDRRSEYSTAASSQNLNFIYNFQGSVITGVSGAAGNILDLIA